MKKFMSSTKVIIYMIHIIILNRQSFIAIWGRRSFLVELFVFS